MRSAPLIVALMLAGCAAQLTPPEAAARKSAANIAAAEAAGYRVVVQAGRTMFCSSQPLTGSHVAPGCLTERQWEQRQSLVWPVLWCPAAAEACGDPQHNLVVLVDPQ